MKYIYRLLIIVVLLIALIIYTISSKYEKLNSIKSNTLNNKFTSTGEGLIEIKDEIEVSSKVSINSTNQLGYMYKVGEENANLFSLSYLDNNLEVGSKLQLKDGNYHASEQLYLIFRETYPNVSLEKMGVSSVEEAYMVTQLAIWEISARTGESIYANELSMIESIKEDIGTKEIPAYIYEKAQKLVELVESFNNNENNIKNDINLVPTLVVRTLDLAKNEIKIDDNAMIGPYKYRVESGIVDNIEINLKDENGNKADAQVVDSRGISIKNLNEVDEFYIKYPQNHSFKEIHIFVKSKVKRVSPCIYMNGDNDYIVNNYIVNEMEQEVTAIF